MRKLYTIFLILILSLTVFSIDPTTAVNATVGTLGTTMLDLVGYTAVYAPSTDNIYVWGGYNFTTPAQTNLVMYRLDMTDNIWYAIDRAAQTCGFIAPLGLLVGGCPGPLADYGAAYKVHVTNRSIIYVGGSDLTAGVLSGNVSSYTMTTATWEILGSGIYVASNFTLFSRTTGGGVATVFMLGGCDAGVGADGCTDSTAAVIDSFNIDTYASPVAAPIGLTTGAGGAVARYNYCGYYNPEDQLAYIYGGLAGGGPGGGAPVFPLANEHLWTWDITGGIGGAFIALADPASIANPRYDCYMTYDNETSQMYIGGGVDAVGYQSDLHTAAWTLAGGLGAFSQSTLIDHLVANGTLVFAKGVGKNVLPNAMFLFGGNNAAGTLLTNVIGFAEPPTHVVTFPYNSQRYVKGTDIDSIIIGTTSTTLAVNQGTYAITYGDVPGGESVVAATAYTFTGTMGTISYNTNLLDPGWYTWTTRVGDGFGFWENTVNTPFQVIIPAKPPPVNPPRPDFILAETMPNNMKTFVGETNGTLYEYVELNIDKLGTDFDLPIVLTFSVPKDWFIGRDVEPEDLKLNWHNDGIWSEMPTEFLEEKGSKYIYQTTLYTFVKYFAVAARTGDCRDFSCGEGEKCALVKDSHYCVPEEQSCNVVCDDGVLDELTCECITSSGKTIASETEDIPLLAIIVGIVSAFLLLGLYILLTSGKKKQEPVQQQQL